MLVLARKNLEKITIRVPEGTSGEIIVTIVDIKANSIRIGFDAPREIEIYRDDAVNKSSQSEVEL